jgi:hypothetical protein
VKRLAPYVRLPVRDSRKKSRARPEKLLAAANPDQTAWQLTLARLLAPILDDLRDACTDTSYVSLVFTPAITPPLEKAIKEGRTYHR